MKSRSVAFTSVLILLSVVFQSCNTTANFSKSAKDCHAFTCVNEVDPEEQEELLKQGKRKLQIYLIRHAKPDLKKKSFYSKKEAQQYIEDYNTVPIIPFEQNMVEVNLRPGHVIYSSNLIRSKQTAQTIFGGKYPIVSDSIFREYELRVVNINTIIKIPLFLWQAFSRGSWMLGWNHGGIESRSEAKIRTKLAAEKLISVAHNEETAVLVAHGMLNGGIEKELKKRGWKVIRKKGHVNLGATILEKIVAD